MEQISLFNDEKDKSKSIILSASRMTDMPKYYPDALISEVMARIKKGCDIHTLVLWTKHPNSLLTDKMIAFVQNLYKLHVYFSLKYFNRIEYYNILFKLKIHTALLHLN